MIFYLNGTDAYLQGDLTYSDMARSSIESMAACLRQIESSGRNNINIDCGKVRAVDTNGLQLLNVWVECARLNGVEPELVNIPNNLQLALQRTGASYSFRT